MSQKKRILNLSSCLTLIRPLFFLLLGLVLVSCISTTQNLADEKEFAHTELSENKALVFGQIHWLENGEQKEIGHGLFDFYIKPSLLRLEDKSRTLCNVSSNGDFLWSLSPGTYVINRIEYRDTWSGNYFFVPQVAFRIPEPQQVYYIGVLEADVVTKRDFIGGWSGIAKFTILDLSDQAYQELPVIHELSRDSIVKSPMIHSKKLPRTIDTTAEYNMTLQILNAILSSM